MTTPEMTPRRRWLRVLVAGGVALVLLGVVVIGVGRFAWEVDRPVDASIGIGITETMHDGEQIEVVVVPYRMRVQDGILPIRLAAYSLVDGSLLWDEPLDAEGAANFPVRVTSAAPGGPVIVATENGSFGFDPGTGDKACGPEAPARCEAGPDAGIVAVAKADESSALWGVDPRGPSLRDGAVVLDPATGSPAGEGYRIEEDSRFGLRMRAGDETVAELGGVFGPQQVLTAPSGKVVLLAAGNNSKSLLVTASDAGLRRAVIGDRGLIAWPDGVL